MIIFIIKIMQSRHREVIQLTQDHIASVKTIDVLNVLKEITLN